jgi:hypothetical protein
MKYALFAGLGLVAVLVIVIGGGVHWFWHVQTVDMTDPQAVTKMHDVASGQCQAQAKETLQNRGVPLSDRVLNTVRHFCDCNADGDVQLLERQKTVSMSDIAGLAGSAEAKDVERHCAAQLGIQMQ